MKTFDTIIADFDNNNPLPIFFEFGYTPESIKQEIIKTFDDFFENKGNLNTHAIDGLSAIWVAYLSLSTLSIQNKKYLIKKLMGLSFLTRKAIKQDESLTIKAFYEWTDNLNEVTNKYWSVKNLENSTALLSLEDMAEASFQMLGQLIEGLMKPYIKFLYHLHLISSKIPTSKLKIDEYDLGKIISDLSNSLDKVLVQPLNVSLNQWRNIAYHHHYIVEGDKIKCTYGKPTNLKHITLSRKKLQDVLKLVYSYFKILKINETIFLYDNLQSIQKHFSNETSREIKIRDESYLISLYSAISTQGFSIKNLSVDGAKTILIIQDLLNADSLKRGIHSSQFLHSIWRFSKSKTIEIHYKKPDGSIYLISKIKSSYLELFDKKNIELSDLIEYTEFDFVGDKNIQNNLAKLKTIKEDFSKKNPFMKHLISAIPTKEKYFLQSGKPITVKEFIKDFSLAVFANYLVFRELNYESNKIKINVGSDGSTICLEDKEILLIVPASIKERFIQQLIMICINDIINLFEKNQLIEQLVSEGKDRVNFKTNLILIKNHLNGAALT